MRVCLLQTEGAYVRINHPFVDKMHSPMGAISLECTEIESISSETISCTCVAEVLEVLPSSNSSGCRSRSQSRLDMSAPIIPVRIRNTAWHNLSAYTSWITESLAYNAVSMACHSVSGTKQKEKMHDEKVPVRNIFKTSERVINMW